MHNFEELLSYFPEAEPKGDQYIARCPMPECFHKDKHLYISEGRNGGAVLYCQKCKAKGPQIMEAMGLPQSFLFLDDDSPAAINKPRVRAAAPAAEKKPSVFPDIPQEFYKNTKAKKARWHTYKDEHGNPVSIKVVYRESPNSEKKYCQWWTPVQGGYTPSKCGKKIPLYNVEKLAQADPATTVYFPEGEKDVETLAALELLAVCTPNGGGQTTWHPSYSQYLKGRHVVIITDNDLDGDTGRKYGETVSKELASVAATVKVIPAALIYPDVGNHGDITDIYEAVGGPQTLKLLHEAEEKTAPLAQIPMTATAQPKQNAIKTQAPAQDQRHPLILKPADFSDAGNAEVFTAAYHEELISSKSVGWLFWNGTRWERDEDSPIARGAKLSQAMLEDASKQNRQALLKLAEAQAAEADETGSHRDVAKAKEAAADAKEYLNHAKQTRGAKKIRDMIYLAGPNFNVKDSQLDAEPAELNTPAGIVDLTTGTIRPHNREAYCTLTTAVAPGTKGQKMWADFLDTITTAAGQTAPDKELQQFLQVVSGMALHGRVYQEGIYIAYGAGRNGKSTFFNALAAVLGDYAGTIDVDVLTTDKQNRGAALATLRGKRLVTAGELEEGRRLSVSTVKKIASTDPYVAEEKYHAPATVIPTHTIFMFSNFLPRVGSNDTGTWRRLKIIPFNAKISSTEDKANFAATLVSEAGPAILQWAIDGAVTFAKNGYRFNSPRCVDSMTDDYRGREDWVQNFLTECCTVDPNNRVKSTDLYSRYKAWAKESGDYVRRRSDFNTAMEQNGFQLIHPKNVATWIGLKVEDWYPL